MDEYTELQEYVLQELNAGIDSLDEHIGQEQYGEFLVELRDSVRDGTWKP